MVDVPVPREAAMKNLNIRFNRQITTALGGVVRREAEQSLSGLSPSERREILQSILVRQNPGGSSLNVHFASDLAVTTEFGTRQKPARPWLAKMQSRLAGSLARVLADLLTPKR